MPVVTVATNAGECKRFAENAAWLWKANSAKWLARQDVAEKWEENSGLPAAEGRSVQGRKPPAGGAGCA